MTGDLNAHPDTNEGQNLKTFAYKNNLTIHVDQPTRITDRASTILDQFITNIPDFVTSISVSPPVSSNDHCTIEMKLLFRVRKIRAYKRLMWDFKNADFDVFRENLKNTDFSFCNNITNIDETCEKWTQTFLKIAKNSILCKMVTVRPNDKPWFNSFLRRLLRKKNRAHHFAKKSNTNISWQYFRDARNEYTSAVANAKKDFENIRYATLAQKGAENPKKWWTLLKSVLGQCSESNIPPLIHNDNIITDDKSKADLFNTFFTNVSDLDDSNADVPDDFTYNNETLENIEINIQDVKDQLQCLDTTKAYGPDGISPKLLKEAAPVIADSLCKLFNASIQQGKIPLTWKQANVIPLFKKDKAELVGNYRPVSLLSILSKILEKIVFKYVYNFFKDNFLISIYQSGFLPGRSTTTQLTELFHIFNQHVSDGKEIRVVFLDIQKAFDCVWKKGLIYKLQNYGIKGKLLAWFVDYLGNRMQRVILNGQYSEWSTLKAGVPQGSVLGPLLFLIFINDITFVIEHCKIRLFADDTCLFITVDNRIDAAEKINKDLENITSWSNKWLVNFSPPKTKSLIISNKKNLHTHPKLNLNGTDIEEVKFHKHLGVYITQNLRWNNHIDDIVIKSSKKLDIMKALKYKLDRKSLEIIYTSFILSVIDYADILYAGTYDSDLCKLDKIQVEAMRVVTGATARSNINALYKDTGWPTLTQRRNFHVLNLFFKIKNNLSPDYLNVIFNSIVQHDNNYNLRSQGNIRNPYTKTESFRRSFFPYAIKMWNALPHEQRDITDFLGFKQAIKPQKLTNELFYYGERWQSVHHARLRIGCSKLNSHLCSNLRVIDSESCECSALKEDPFHFLFLCPLYDEMRITMFNKVSPLSIITVEVLLYGNNDLSMNKNCLIFDSVHEFIKNTKRFD